MFKESKFIKNAGWLMVLQGVNIIVPFLTVPYVTRIFGASNYGIFAVALNWVTYFQMIVEYGFDLSATRRVVRVADDPKKLGSLVSAVVIARLLLVAICLAVTGVLAVTCAATGEQLGCMIVLFSMLVGIALQLNWLFLGLQDMKFITVATALARVASAVLIVLMVNRADQLLLYSFLYSFTFLLSGLLTQMFAWKKYHVRFAPISLKDVCEAFKDGFPLFLSYAASKIISNVGVTVLSVFQTAAVVGSYSVALKIPQIINMMFSPVSQALYPRVNEVCLRSKGGAKRYVLKLAIPVIGGFAVCLTVIVLLRRPLVGFLFGEDYLSCADTLIPLAIWVILGVVNNFLGVQLLIPFGYQDIYSKLILADSILSLVLNIALGAVFGAMGVASAVAIAEAVLTVLLHFNLRKVSAD